MTITTVYQVCGFSVDLAEVCEFILQNPDHEFSQKLNKKCKKHLQELVDYYLEKNNFDDIPDYLWDYYNDLIIYLTCSDYDDRDILHTFRVSHDAQNKYGKYKEDIIIGGIVASINFENHWSQEVDPDHIFIIDKKFNIDLSTKLINHPLNKSKSLKLFSIQDMCSCCT
jgi:hypothetical protein